MHQQGLTPLRPFLLNPHPFGRFFSSSLSLSLSLSLLFHVQDGKAGRWKALSFVLCRCYSSDSSRFLRHALVHHSIPRRFPSREREMKRPERERESFVSLDDPAQREKKRKKKKPTETNNETNDASPLVTWSLLLSLSLSLSLSRVRLLTCVVRSVSFFFLLLLPS